MAGSLSLKNEVQLVTQLPQSQRQVHDVLSAAESVPPISDSEVTCGPMTRPATLSSSAASSWNSTDFSSSSMSLLMASSAFGITDARVPLSDLIYTSPGHPEHVSIYCRFTNAVTCVCIILSDGCLCTACMSIG